MSRNWTVVVPEVVIGQADLEGGLEHLQVDIRPLLLALWSISLELPSSVSGEQTCSRKREVAIERYEFDPRRILELFYDEFALLRVWP